jgi:hypothetical protein
MRRASGNSGVRRDGRFAWAYTSVKKICGALQRRRNFGIYRRPPFLILVLPAGFAL